MAAVLTRTRSFLLEINFARGRSPRATGQGSGEWHVCVLPTVHRARFVLTSGPERKNSRMHPRLSNDTGSAREDWLWSAIPMEKPRSQLDSASSTLPCRCGSLPSDGELLSRLAFKGKQYLVFGICLYAATSRLIDIDISDLRRNPLIKRINFWHMHCSEKKRPLS